MAAGDAFTCTAPRKFPASVAARDATCGRRVSPAPYLPVGCRAYKWGDAAPGNRRLASAGQNCLEHRSPKGAVDGQCPTKQLQQPFGMRRRIPLLLELSQMLQPSANFTAQPLYPVIHGEYVPFDAGLLPLHLQLVVAIAHAIHRSIRLIGMVKDSHQSFRAGAQRL